MSEYYDSYYQTSCHNDLRQEDSQEELRNQADFRVKVSYGKEPTEDYSSVHSYSRD